MRVLLDTNIVLDILIERHPWQQPAGYIATAIAEGRLQAYVSASSITDIFYISRRLKGLDDARHVVSACLDTFEIISVTRELLEAADRHPSGDFEDNLQIECAIAAGLNAVVTRDFQGFAGSPLHVLSPFELVSLLEQSHGQE